MYGFVQYVCEYVYGFVVCEWVCIVRVSMCMGLYSLCVYALRDEIVNSFRIFDETLGPNELCNSVFCQKQPNPPKLF